MDEVKNEPLVSVIMAVYKEPLHYLREAIESILNQTYENLEFIIVLDNPENSEANEFLISYVKSDSRVQLIVNEENMGLALSLNKAIKLANGTFIARMDADDVSKLNRLSVQVEYLVQNPEVDLIGTNVEKIDKNGNGLGLMAAPNLEKYEPKQIIKYRTVAFHPTWLLKKSLYEEMSFYNPLLVAQDYDFLYRCILQGRNIFNLKDVLLEYRISGQNVSVEKSLVQLKTKFFVQKYSSNTKFDVLQYRKYIKSSFALSTLHRYSTILFISAMNDEGGVFRYIKLAISCLLSPYQMMHVYSQLTYKVKYP